jgi:hypothetical protein
VNGGLAQKRAKPAEREVRRLAAAAVAAHPQQRVECGGADEPAADGGAMARVVNGG